jgi:hypothetical protein
MHFASLLTRARTGLRAGFLAAVLLPLGLAAQSNSTGALVGRVTNEITGSLLDGALVRLPELNRETRAEREGAFFLGRIPTGEWTLLASYPGADPLTLRVTVAADTTTRIEIPLRADIYDLERIFVSARAEGQAEAIGLQRSAPTYRTIVSSDALGQIREGNIGDALVRLPGLSVETRAGVQRTATIRGLAPQYNTVTVDGLRMTNVDGNRDIALDTFPSNMLARVEVVKANTPSLPSDAIGGTVELVTKTAFDREGRVLEGDIGTTYNDVRDNWNRQASITFADRFGRDGKLGLLASLAYFHDERGYDVAQTAYTGAIVNRTLYYDRYEIKDL